MFCLKPEVSIQRAIDNAGGLKPENLAEIEKTLKKQGFLCTHNKIQGFKYLTFKKGDFETSFKANKSTVEIIKTEEIETIKKTQTKTSFACSFKWPADI